MSARAWSKKIAGMKALQGKALAWILAHLLMFSDVGIEAERGIIFQQVTGVVIIFGNVDNQVIILQNAGGNGAVEQTFFMPANSNNGQIIVNGALVP